MIFELIRNTHMDRRGIKQSADSVLQRGLFLKIQSESLPPSVFSANIAPNAGRSGRYAFRAITTQTHGSQRRRAHQPSNPRIEVSADAK